MFGLFALLWIIVKYVLLQVKKINVDTFSSLGWAIPEKSKQDEQGWGGGGGGGGGGGVIEDVFEKDPWNF